MGNESAKWGNPTESEVESVVYALLKRHPDVVHAAESLYGASRKNTGAFQQAIRHAMKEGGIRRIDGQKWGTGGIVTDINLSLPNAISTAPSREPPLPRQAVVTGTWSLHFCSAPDVPT